MRIKKQDLDQLFADVSPKRRRAMFDRAYNITEQILVEVEADREMTASERAGAAKKALECLQLLAQLNLTAWGRGRDEKKLIAAVANAPEGNVPDDEFWSRIRADLAQYDAMRRH